MSADVPTARVVERLEGAGAGVVCPAGPMLLRGPHVVEDGQGRRHVTTRPVSALCRCGRSARSPWCDGTHKVLQVEDRP